MRQGLVLALMGTLMLAAGCSGSGGSFTLRGTPTPRSGTNTGNFIVQGKDCKYVTMVGYYSADAPVTSYPCKLLQDDDNSLGDPHAHVVISITTPKGEQTVKIDGTQAGMTATQVPDLGNNYPFPAVWAVAPPATTMMLVNNDGNATKVVIKISGVECAMTINNSPQNCGLSYWSDGAFSVWVPGLLVDPAYASYLLNLSFGKTAPGQWSLARPAAGFPATYGEVAAK